jgi:hypothetical protein
MLLPRFFLLAGGLIIIAVSFDSCSSGKNAYEHGDYYEAVTTSINRLRRNPDNKKSAETLRQAYPLAVKYYEDRANAAIASGKQFKWSTVVQSYTTINSMYEEIRRSPGALRVIPNPVNYYSKLEEAKMNAAEENYAAGTAALALNSREQAKLAYQFFKSANDFVPGYKDVNEKMEEALWAATIKVVMEPIPIQARNIAVSAEFFNDKMSEYLHSTSINPFVRFFTLKEAQTLNIQPDQVIRLVFDDFTVGQVYLSERQIQLQKDSVVVGSYFTESLATDQNQNGPVKRTISKADGTASSSDTGNQIPVNSSVSTQRILPDGQQGNSVNSDSGSGTNGVNTVNQSDNKDQVDHDNSGDLTGANQHNTETRTAQKSNDPANQKDTSKDKVQESKVTICHIPPGNKGNAHTLVVAQSALQAHLNHGDALGFCDQQGGNQNKSGNDKGQGTNKNGSGNKGDQGRSNNASQGGNEQSSLKIEKPVYLASMGSNLYQKDPGLYEVATDTNYVYASVKATYHQFQKTVTSSGVINFSIIDPQTNGLLTVEKMPGQYVWVSEWAYFNGDERALTSEQLDITRQREQTPPEPQELFIVFTIPIFDQITAKIWDFYHQY